MAKNGFPPPATRMTEWRMEITSTERLGTAILCAFLSTAAVAADDDRAFIDWAKARAAPLEGDKAFQALDADIATVRLIGVGESVHESATFAQFRARHLKDAVRRHRVTALVMEAGMPETMAADDYVTGRTSKVDVPSEAIEWLRAWNLGEGKDRPVRLYGADFSGRAGSMLPTLDRLAELAKGNDELLATIEALRPAAAKLEARWWKPAKEKYDALPPHEKALLVLKARGLFDQAGKATGPNAEWIQRLALLIRYYEAFLRLDPFSPGMPREQAMADTLLWVVGKLPEGEKAIYWAHNAHVQRTATSGPALPPGEHVSAGMLVTAVLGAKYYAIATAYGGPSLDKDLPPDPDGLDAILGAVAPAPFILPLRGSRPEAVDQWLDVKRSLRFQVQYVNVAPGRAVDALVYFDRAAKPSVRY